MNLLRKNDLIFCMHYPKYTPTSVHLMKQKEIFIGQETNLISNIYYQCTSHIQKVNLSVERWSSLIKRPQNQIRYPLGFLWCEKAFIQKPGLHIRNAVFAS